MPDESETTQKTLLAEGKDPSVQKQLDLIDAHVRARMTSKEVADEYTGPSSIESLHQRRCARSAGTSRTWPSHSTIGQLIKSQLPSCFTS